MRFSFKKMYGRLAGTKQAAVIVNEVTVRWGSTVLERVIPAEVHPSYCAGATNLILDSVIKTNNDNTFRCDISLVRDWNSGWRMVSFYNPNIDGVAYAPYWTTDDNKVCLHVNTI